MTFAARPSSRRASRKSFAAMSSSAAHCVHGARMLHESPPSPKPAAGAKEQPKAVSREARSGNEESSPQPVPFPAFVGAMLTALAAVTALLAKVNRC